MSEILKLEVTRTKDGVMVAVDGLSAHGVGKDLFEATEEWVSMLYDLYLELKDDEEVLGPDLARQLKDLNRLNGNDE